MELILECATEVVEAYKTQQSDRLTASADALHRQVNPSLCKTTADPFLLGIALFRALSLQLPCTEDPLVDCSVIALARASIGSADSTSPTSRQALCYLFIVLQLYTDTTSNLFRDDDNHRATLLRASAYVWHRLRTQHLNQQPALLHEADRNVFLRAEKSIPAVSQFFSPDLIATGERVMQQILE